MDLKYVLVSQKPSFTVHVDAYARITTLHEHSTIISLRLIIYCVQGILKKTVKHSDWNQLKNTGRHSD